MFALTASQRFFLYSQPVDMRKSFDALSGIITTGLGKDVLSGDVYIFIGKSRDKIKLLVWEKGGFVLYYKRLESGTFHLPKQQDYLSYSELCLLIEGVEVQVTHRRKRYERPEQKITAPP
ncbi:IS66 family insertion sequence element accessory protein TnpB [Rhodocytophaga aerolata]|uniref:IS66 family insertion sequence element accessory protein TnpB n=1 Tax=Rhodocytophaga aerolata TaxID=455078 RepID=A0ABT8RGX1_9BACT|nr:IS66 family insertion sequence element accessory protein TnpB [Rhodocytophaga aerolata]MDO1451356.1 IS66 family insertion sequence element accessory protein TnpB [Rhodocytophaga aerolata]